VNAVPAERPSGPDALAELQQVFAAALLARDGQAAMPALEPGPVSPATALAVHRTNTRVGFARALASAFPAVAALMGRPEFEAMAWSYQRSHPPACGDLFFAGERLPAFLAQHLAGTVDEALAAVAALEWQVQRVMVAADPAGAIDLEALAGVSAARHGDLCFAASPMAVLHRAPAGTVALWEQYREVPPGDAPAGPMPAVAADVEHLLLSRDGGRLALRVLSAGEATLLAALFAGEPFGAAVDAALAVDPGLAAGAVLASAVQRGLIIGFRLRN
jgi:hypothetical protein